MKRNIAAIISVLAGLVWSCTDQSPVELTFEDVYGRPGWEMETADTTKYYYIAKENDLTWEQQEGTGEASFVYKIRTTGARPSITTQRLITPTTGKVLSFMYKSSRDITPSVHLDARNPETESRMWPMKATAEWTQFTFDTSIIGELCSWGTQGSSVTIIFGDEAGVDIEIKDIEVRAYTSPEQKISEALYITFVNEETGEQMRRLEDITDYGIKTYAAHTAAITPNPEYRYGRSVADPRPRALTEEDNQICFEYMCDEGVDITFWWKAVANYDAIKQPLEAASEWTAVKLDVSGFTAKIFADTPQFPASEAGPVNGQTCIDIERHVRDENSEITFYIRGLRLETR
ncbi:MAG: hypothetical protein LIO85_05275 [Rikenellaceae bacterium]|nr:hypothetical protein [Rikenellaceae bacterium]